ncbi:MAG TPA: histidine kinase, partial [Candidatus Binataceae bacterium]|nr:histidine kinase [Candidatus Binataceae bacterium]
MVPYRGRLALRIARLGLAAACLAWYLHAAEERVTSALAILAAYAVYALGALLEVRFDSRLRAGFALIADVAFFGFWSWMIGAGMAGGASAGWISAALCGYVLTASAVLHDLVRVSVVSGVVALLAALFAPHGEMPPLWIALTVSSVAICVALHKRYLQRRLSPTLRHNVLIRSQAQGAREAERERIAADFHDGPLQSFISFQMRLEIIRKLLARDVEAARQELVQLQDLCKMQVSDLRSFVRSMRPPDEGVSLPASLSRMVDQFQRDSGIRATFSSVGNLHDPAETEVSLELLQIVRETMHNVQKHSG